MIAIGAASIVIMLGWSLRPQWASRAVTSRPVRWWRWFPPLVLAIAVSPVAGATLAVVMATWRRWAGIRRRRRDHRRRVAAYPDGLDLLVLSIRAGYLPAQAVVEITPFLPASLHDAFDSVGAALRRGARFADALGELHTRLGPIVLPLVDSLAAADRYGLPLAPVLERLSFEARQQRRRDAEATARELPVRLAMPLVLCTLPSFVLLAIVPLLLGALSSLHT